jgi:adenylate cyclase
MGLEIERKFRVTSEAWRALGKPLEIRQGYLSAYPACTVRVRLTADCAWLTVKGLSKGASRSEFEYRIPLADAGEMLDTLCAQPLLEKRRTRIPLGDVTWEVDEFLGENLGLVVAEVELRSADQALELPPWIGEEVTHDARYFNSHLLTHPYSRWSERRAD